MKHEFLKEILTQYEVESSQKEMESAFQSAGDSFTLAMESIIAVESAVIGNFNRIFGSEAEVTMESINEYERSTALIFQAAGLSVPTALLSTSFEADEKATKQTAADKKDNFLKAVGKALWAAIQRFFAWLKGLFSKKDAKLDEVKKDVQEEIKNFDEVAKEEPKPEPKEESKDEPKAKEEVKKEEPKVEPKPSSNAAKVPHPRILSACINFEDSVAAAFKMRTLKNITAEKIEDVALGTLEGLEEIKKQFDDFVSKAQETVDEEFSSRAELKQAMNKINADIDHSKANARKTIETLSEVETWLGGMANSDFITNEHRAAFVKSFAIIREISQKNLDILVKYYTERFVALKRLNRTFKK